jgi:hypothetical protein
MILGLLNYNFCEWGSNFRKPEVATSRGEDHSEDEEGEEAEGVSITTAAWIKVPLHM